jgi:hypothetical protein
MAVKGDIVTWAKKEIEIKNFEQYVNVIKELKQHFFDDLILFRGQNCDKPLLPKVAREKVTKAGVSIKDFEKHVFDDFKKRYIAYSKREFNNDWDLLALGQHHGLPTRLLDWTTSAMVALFFAVEKEMEDEKCGIVWFFVPDNEDIITDEEKQQEIFSTKVTKVFAPNHISERITAQQGWFTRQKIFDDGRVLKLESQLKYKKKIKRLIIKNDLFPEMRVMLDTMGVNATTVFPDLQGLSNYLDWKYLKRDLGALEPYSDPGT